jgi:hypothetical protein
MTRPVPSTPPIPEPRLAYEKPPKTTASDVAVIIARLDELGARLAVVERTRTVMPEPTAAVPQLLTYDDLWTRFMNALAGMDALEAQCAALQDRVLALEADKDVLMDQGEAIARERDEWLKKYDTLMESIQANREQHKK